jgi:hypothetical protein
MKPQTGAGSRDAKEKQKRKNKENVHEREGEKVFLAFLSDWLTFEDVTDRLTRNVSN